MASIREAPCNKERFSKKSLDFLKYFCVFLGKKVQPISVISIKKISLRGAHLHLPCGAPLPRQVADKGGISQKKIRRCAGSVFAHPRLGPSRSRGSLPE